MAKYTGNWYFFRTFVSFLEKIKKIRESAGQNLLIANIIKNQPVVFIICFLFLYHSFILRNYSMEGEHCGDH